MDFYNFLPVLDDALVFPDVESASPQGILAQGGDLSLERLQLAYRSGIFPWYSEGEPILWWAPPYRMVIVPEFYKAHKSVVSLLKKNTFQITFNQNFREVIENCKNVKRYYEDGTWITNDIVEAYIKLHEIGLAKSVEVWKDGNLVGGLYGIDLGHIFTGESMFHKVSNASKVALVWLIEKLKKESYTLLDCQVHNPHLERLGAFEVHRDLFMMVLENEDLKIRID
jgi:leucyl/phenylalanyl-tRNA--protein transferase